MNFDVALSQNSGMTTDPAVTMIYFFGKAITEGGLNYSQIGREVPSWAAAMTAGHRARSRHVQAVRQSDADHVREHAARPALRAGAFIFKRNGISLDVGPRTLDPVNIGRPKS